MVFGSLILLLATTAHGNGTLLQDYPVRSVYLNTKFSIYVLIDFPFYLSSFFRTSKAGHARTTDQE